MITHILHTGVVHASTIQPSSDTVVISILDYNSRHPRPNFSGFRDSLSLCFKDRCEEDYGVKSHWPDEIPDNLQAFYTGDELERICNLSDAEKILRFFDKHHRDPQPINLVAHCKSGVGRSAAIAHWFGTVYGISYHGTDLRKRFNPNPRVIRMLNKAYNQLHKTV